MFCNQCGTEIPANFTACPKCGTPAAPNEAAPTQFAPTTHSVPKCNHCGHIGEWKVESILRPVDIIIFVLLLFLFGAGFVYLIITLIVRSNPDNRAKICTQCKSRNMFTFNY